MNYNLDLENILNSSPNFSVIKMIERDFYKKASEFFDNNLKNYVIENLKELGFEFENEIEFIDFISKRVMKIGFANKPNEYELFLDYHSSNRKLIGRYNDNVTFNCEGSKITATFGKNFD